MCGLACITMLRVFILIALASVVWVPIGIWVGMRPRAAQIVQPVAQFMAAFPANLLFPDRGVRHRRLEAQSGRVPESADDSRHAVVHPVQHHRRRVHHSGRDALCRREFRRQGLAVVAQGGAAGRAAVLRHRRHHRFGRIVERRAGLRARDLGPHGDPGARTRLLYRGRGGGR